MENASNLPNISKETLIGDIVEKYPHLVETLLSFGVHCVGCHVSPFEALGDGLAGHGMDETKIQSCINTLKKVHNEHVKQAAQETKNPDTNQDSSSNNTQLTITLTAKAVAKIKELTVAHQKDALMVAVKPGGCSGYEYVLELVNNEDKKDNQVTISQDGIQVFIDKPSLEIMNGSQIDFKDSLQDAGFKITNPKAKNTCGCGNSFS